MKEQVFYEDLTYKIIGEAIKIHNELGPIHKEVIYQKALEKSLKDIGLTVEREVDLPVKFRDVKVGTYRPDFVVDHKILIELKALDFLPQKAEVQLSYYLKATGFKIGLLLNFGSPRLQIKRRIYDQIKR